MNKKRLVVLIIFGISFILIFFKDKIDELIYFDQILFNGESARQAFFDNCGLPNAESLQVLELNDDTVFTFKLAHNDVGLCSSDKRKRHSAPYWERAELKQTAILERNKQYQLDFSFKILQGFNGSRETFFQLHNYKKGCKTSPAAMLKADDGKLLVWLKAKGETQQHSLNLLVSDILLQQQQVRWIIDTHDTANISVVINGELVLNAVPMDLPLCGNPHLKFGIYRPGTDTDKNRTSEIEFAKMRLLRYRDF